MQKPDKEEQANDFLRSTSLDLKKQNNQAFTNNKDSVKANSKSKAKKY